MFLNSDKKVDMVCLARKFYCFFSKNISQDALASWFFEASTVKNCSKLLKSIIQLNYA